MWKWKRPLMTYQENETTKAGDNREKVSNGSSANRLKAWGMMAT